MMIRPAFSGKVEEAGTRAKWKEVSRTVEELGMLAKDKKGTWVKSCKESSVYP